MQKIFPFLAASHFRLDFDLLCMLLSVQAWHVRSGLRRVQHIVILQEVLLMMVITGSLNDFPTTEPTVLYLSGIF